VGPGVVGPAVEGSSAEAPGVVHAGAVGPEASPGGAAPGAAGAADLARVGRAGPELRSAVPPARDVPLPVGVRPDVAGQGQRPGV
jgi:hypothetical protein